MKKNLFLMLGLSLIVLLAGCGDQKVENSDIDNPEPDAVVSEETVGSEWAITSFTVEDLEDLENGVLPISYSYETYDMQKWEIVDSGSRTISEWEQNGFFVPEFDKMVSREVISSGIEDDMIYTISRMTLDDDSTVDMLYVNDPDTLLFKAVSVQNGDLTTLYSNFVYDTDVE